MASVGIDRVGQPGRAHEKGAVLDRHDDLIGILGGEFRHRRPDDSRLRSWIVEIYGAGPFVSLHVIDAARKILG